MRTPGVNDIAVRSFVVRSRFAQTGLTCTDAVAGRIRQLTEPYFAVEPGEPEPGSWQVVSGCGTPHGVEPQTLDTPGEVSVHYGLDEAGKTFFHVAPQTIDWVSQSLLRTTRSIHRSAASREGSLFLHSGLVDLAGLGVALVGGSRAGKTTFIMASVLDGVGTMVCNDDLSATFDANSGATCGAGWPRSISVRLDTLDLLFGRDQAESLRAGLSHPANQTLSSLQASGVEPHGTALIYPWEYAALLDTTIGVRARVDVVVHLSLADRRSESTFTDIEPAARGELLEPRVLRKPNKGLNAFGHEPAPGALDRTREALFALPTYRFCYEFRDVRRQVDRLAGLLGRELRASPAPRP